LKYLDLFLYNRLERFINTYMNNAVGTGIGGLRPGILTGKKKQAYTAATQHQAPLLHDL
jgi:hypothetical protein